MKTRLFLFKCDPLCVGSTLSFKNTVLMHPQVSLRTVLTLKLGSYSCCSFVYVMTFIC